MLDPTRPRIDLPQFLLCHRNGAKSRIENDRPGRCRALVDRNEMGHRAGLLRLDVNFLRERRVVQDETKTRFPLGGLGF
jgi:hypothetical protein